MQVNNYVSPLYTGTDVSKTSTKSGSSSLGIDDFLKLLTAQLANQDMMNPSSDTEFIAQLAQFSSLQAMDSMAKISTMSQSTDLVGKTVIVTKYDKDNKLETVQGVVEKVTLFQDTPKIYVNGKEYEYSNVMEILSSANTSKPAESTGSTSDTEGSEDDKNQESDDVQKSESV